MAVQVCLKTFQSFRTQRFRTSEIQGIPGNTKAEAVVPVLILALVIGLKLSGMAGCAHVPAEVKSSIEDLKSTDPQIRAIAVFRLEEMGEKAAPAAPYLVDLLGDMTNVKNKYGRGNILLSIAADRALSRIGKPAVKHLIPALKHDHHQARISAAYALGQIGDKRAFEPLIDNLKDEHWGVRINTALALAKFKDPRAVEPLIAAVDDPNSFVRGPVVEALGQIGHPSAVKTLESRLSDESSGVRREAAKALGKIKDPGVVDSLIKTLNDSDWQARREASWALGEINDPKAIQPLIKALEDENSVVSNAAFVSLRKITGQDFGRDADGWRKWWEAK